MMFLSFRFLSFSFMPCLPIDLNLLYSAVVSMGILCVPFRTIGTCLCPVGEPVPFSRILFPFLVLFSYDVPFLSFPFLFFYAFFAHWSESAVFCCSFHGHSMCSFPHCSHVFVPCGGTCSLVSCPLPFSCPFLLWCSFPFLSFSFPFLSFPLFFSLSFPFLLCLFCPLTESAVFCCSFHGHSMCSFPHCSHVFVPCGGTCSFLSYPLHFSCPFLRPMMLLSFRFLSFPFLSFPFLSFPFPSFPFFFPFPFLLCLFAHWSKSAVFCCSFHGHSMCSFPHCSHVFVPCGGTCSFLSYPIHFSCPFLLWCSFPFFSFSFMPCLLIDLNLLYSAVVSMGILCVPFPTVATCLCPVGEPVPFSRVLFPFLVLFSYDFPFLSFSSMPFLPIDLNLLYSAVVSMGILCVPFPTIGTCLCPVGEPVPFSRVLFPFLVLFCYDVPFLSFPFLFFDALFAHWSEFAVFCCSFHGHSMCSFPHCSHVFVPCGGTCSLFSCPLPFSCPFLLWCSFPFLSFPVLSFPFISSPYFLSVPFLLCLFCPLIWICCIQL